MCESSLPMFSEPSHCKMQAAYRIATKLSAGRSEQLPDGVLSCRGVFTVLLMESSL